MKLYHVLDDQGRLVMTTPINILGNCFQLDRPAIRRIEAETKNGGVCILHFNGRSHLPCPCSSKVEVMDGGEW